MTENTNENMWMNLEVGQLTSDFRNECPEDEYSDTVARIEQLVCIMNSGEEMPLAPGLTAFRCNMPELKQRIIDCVNACAGLTKAELEKIKAGGFAILNLVDPKAGTDEEDTGTSDG